MQDLTGRAARRLYEVSRDRYAPVLAAFAVEWLDELVRHPDDVAICLGRDGLAPFLAARVLLRIYPRRFRGVHPRRVQLAYVSRPLATGAVADAGQAMLLDRYLRGRGAAAKKSLTLVDVGIHGSIQDCLQRIYPGRRVRGRYLVLRRRDGDPHGARKRGFPSELDVAPRSLLAVEPSWPPPPGWELGGRLRGGDALFLRPRSIHVLEDLWNGVGEAAEGLRVAARNGRVVAVRRRVDQVLALPPESTMTPVTRVMLKRAALRGVVDGVVRGLRDDEPGDISATAHGLAAWLRELEEPVPVDAHILRTLARDARRLLAALTEARPAWPAPPHLVHGDFSASHVYLTTETTTVIDWDAWGVGDCAEDAGRFLARSTTSPPAILSDTERWPGRRRRSRGPTRQWSRRPGEAWRSTRRWRACGRRRG